MPGALLSENNLWMAMCFKCFQRGCTTKKWQQQQQITSRSFRKSLLNKWAASTIEHWFIDSYAWALGNFIIPNVEPSIVGYINIPKSYHCIIPFISTKQMHFCQEKNQRSNESGDQWSPDLLTLSFFLRLTSKLLSCSPRSEIVRSDTVWLSHGKNPPTLVVW